jgi:flagellar biosynthetic protein FliP
MKKNSVAFLVVLRLSAAIVVLLLAAVHAYAAAPAQQAQGVSLQIPGMSIHGDANSWTIVALLTFLTLVPAMVLCMTPFVRILIIFHFLRQALGTQSTPTNQTLIGLSIFLTYFLMVPVGSAIRQQAIEPLEAGTVTVWEAVDRGSTPLRHFMLQYTREKDLALFVEMSKQARPKEPEDIPMSTIIPAYILSEIKTGFQIGAILFLPFLVIDMVTASITTSIGMMQLPPVVISTPLKILLFVVADGWNLVVGSLMKSFH